MKKSLLLVFFTIVSFTGFSQLTTFVGDTTGLVNERYGPIYRSGGTSTRDFSCYSYIYSAAELGWQAGTTINTIAWKKSSSGSLTGNMCDVKILMRNTVDTGFDGRPYYDTIALSPTYTTVLNDLNANFDGGADTWVEFTLTTPFVYTGNNLNVTLDYARDGATSNSKIEWYVVADTLKTAGDDEASAFISGTGQQMSNSRSHYMPATRFRATAPGGSGGGSTSNNQVVVGDTTGSEGHIYGPMYRSSGTSSNVYSAYSYLYTAAELNITPGTYITKVAWKKSNNEGVGGNASTVQILMRNSSKDTFDLQERYDSIINPGRLSTVYFSTTDNIGGNAGDWVEYTLNSPFLYTGGALQVSYDFFMDIPGGATNINGGNPRFYYELAAGLGVGEHRSSAFSASTLTDITRSGARPATRFDTDTVGGGGPVITSNAVVFGDTTGAASDSHIYGPIYRSSTSSSQDYCFYGYLFEASELSGLSLGDTITSVSWRKANNETITGNQADFAIYMQNTAVTQLSARDNYGNIIQSAANTTVYSDTNANVIGNANTWAEYQFSTPFVYTGGSLIVATDFALDGGTVSGNVRWYYQMDTLKGYGDDASAPFVSTDSTSTSRSNHRPTTRFGFSPGVGSSPCPDAGLDTAATLCDAVPSIDLNTLLRGASTGGTFLDTDASGALTGSNVSSGGLTAGIATNFSYFVTTVNCTNDTSVITITIEAAVSAGADAADTICDTNGVVDLSSFLTAGVTTGGSWVDVDASGALSGNVFDPSIVTTGSTYNFTYTVAGVICQSDVANVSLFVADCDVSLKENVLNTIQLFPNPTKGIIFIEDTDKNGASYSVQVLSLDGKSLKTVTFKDKNKQELDLSNLSEGFYMVKVSSEKGTKMFKVLVEN